MGARAKLQTGLIVVLALQLAAFSSVTEGQETKYWAVVAGVADYAYISDLSLTDDDASAFVAALESYPHWSGADQIELLIDSDASKEGLYSAVERMGEKADADTGDHDVCVFFFSGHGTQMFDPSGEESDLYDEAICAWDFRSFWSFTMGGVTDDELGIWLSKLLPEDADIICIFDTCFAGGLARGAEGLRVKSFRNSYVPERAKARKPFGEGLMEQLAGPSGGAHSRDISGPNAVVLMACEENALSWEDWWLGHGVFSYYLLEGLTTDADVADADSNDMLSAEELFDYAQPQVVSYTWGDQRPQLYDGNPALESVLVLLSGAGPASVSITSPTEGATVSGNVDIVVVAACPVGITRVDFYVDGALVGSDTSADPGDIYTYTWDSTGVVDGPQTITVTAVDAASRETSTSITVDVDNYADPLVSIDAPPPGSVLSGLVDIQVSAAPAQGRAIIAVECYLDELYLGEDTSAPYSVEWDTTLDSNGTYTLRAVATDDYGQTGEDTITVTLDNEVSGFRARVASVVVTLRQRRRYWYAIATVTVTDGRGRLLDRVRVSGCWSLATTDRDSGLTDENGEFDCRSNRVRSPSSGTVFRFTVDHVSWVDGVWDGVMQSGEATVD